MRSLRCKFIKAQIQFTFGIVLALAAGPVFGRTLPKNLDECLKSPYRILKEKIIRGKKKRICFVPYRMNWNRKTYTVGVSKPTHFVAFDQLRPKAKPRFYQNNRKDFGQFASTRGWGEISSAGPAATARLPATAEPPLPAQDQVLQTDHSSWASEPLGEEVPTRLQLISESAKPALAAWEAKSEPAAEPQPLQQEIAALSADQADSPNGKDPRCDFDGDTLVEENCMRVLAQVEKGKIPKKAFEYSLGIFREARGKYCGGSGIGSKVRNQCSFFFTDLDQRYKDSQGQKFPHQSPAFLINLCAGDSGRGGSVPLVHHTSTRRGPASSGNDYRDIPGAGTTLPGVFVTQELTGFTPFEKSQGSYRSIGYRKPGEKGSEKCEGTGNLRNNYLSGCPVIRLSLERLQTERRARSVDSKPMHTTPFKSSAGCPSLNQKDNWIMRHLAKGGRSLYIAYTDPAKVNSKITGLDRLANLFDAPKKVCKQSDKRMPAGTIGTD